MVHSPHLSRRLIPILASGQASAVRLSENTSQAPPPLAAWPWPVRVTISSEPQEHGCKLSTPYPPRALRGSRARGILSLNHHEVQSLARVLFLNSESLKFISPSTYASQKERERKKKSQGNCLLISGFGHWKEFCKLFFNQSSYLGKLEEIERK